MNDQTHFHKVAMPLTDRLRMLISRPVKRVKPLLERVLPNGLRDPSDFVGTSELSGQLQFEILQREGCRHDSRVLEIGCGNLHAGVPLIKFLEKGHYTGIDPNEWLRDRTLKNRQVRELVREKQTRFLSRDDFDASKLGIRFDFVLSQPEYTEFYVKTRPNEVHDWFVFSNKSTSAKRHGPGQPERPNAR